MNKNKNKYSSFKYTDSYFKNCQISKKKSLFLFIRPLIITQKRNGM